MTEQLEREESNWVYFVALDGDYAGHFFSLEEAEVARLNERGHIDPATRTIWREKTVTEFYSFPYVKTEAQDD